MSLLDDSVKEVDGAWTFICPVTSGCGDVDGGFVSSGWPTKKVAKARGQQHFDEHKGLGLSRSLEEFRREHGLVVQQLTGAVTVGDLP